MQMPAAVRFWSTATTTAEKAQISPPKVIKLGSHPRSEFFILPPLIEILANGRSPSSLRGLAGLTGPLAPPQAADTPPRAIRI
jgi:hypothetical protein